MSNSKVATTDPDGGGIAMTEMGTGNGPQAIPTEDEEEGPRPDLKRSQSMVEHLDEHKHKYGAACIISTIVVVLVIVFVVVLAVAATVVAVDSDSAVATAIKSAVTATKIETVSIIPAKGSSSSRRRLMEAPKTAASTSAFNEIFDLSDGVKGFLTQMSAEKNLRGRARKLQTVVATTALPGASDYNLQTEPSMYVAEDAASALNLVNMIGCYMGQLRIPEVGINSTCNPGSKPYVALVQNSVCSSSDTTYSTWYVDYTGPEGFGDGEYAGNAMFNSGGMKIAIRMRATITGGAKVSQQVNYYMAKGANQRGGFFRETSSADTAQLWFMSHMAADITAAINTTAGQQLQGDSLYAEYNPTTFIGKCFTTVADEDTGTKTKYQLQISDTAIYKKTIAVDNAGNEGTAVDNCVDFREASQMVVANSYFLYNAENGDSLTYQSGFPVLKTVDAAFLSTVPTLKGIPKLEAYIDYWGLYWSGMYNSTSESYISNENMAGVISGLTPSYTTGIAVEKESYTSTGNTQYTLKVAPGRLEKITMSSLSLGEIKGLPLTINNWGNADVNGDVIMWDGSSFKLIGDSGLACISVDVSNWAQTVIVKDIATDKDCLCYDVASSSVRTSGAMINWGSCSSDCRNTQSFTKMAGSNASASIDYPISASTFSRGIDVKTESDVLYGQIKLVYEPVVSLYGVNPGTYTKGQVVTQTYVDSSSNTVTATGTVFATTDPALYGLACSSCITLVSKDYSTCAVSGSSSTGSMVPKGTTLTQGSVVAVVTSYAYVSSWGSVPMKFISGTAFVTGTNIIASWDAANAATIGAESYYFDVSGTIGWSTTDGIASQWDGLLYGDSGCATASAGSGYISNFAVSGSTGGTASMGLHTDSNGNQKWFGYVTNQGSSCTLTGPVQLTASDLSSAGITCTTYPMLNVKCNRRTEAASRDIEVMMESKTATPFTTCSTRNCPISVATVTAGSPHWMQKKQGGIKTVTDSTLLVYRQQSIVVAGDTVPALSCYNNCPNVATTSAVDAYASYAAPSILDPNAWIGNDGLCTVAPTGMTFANIGGSPAATAVWELTGKSPASYYLSTFELTNTGAVCTSTTTPTVTFTGGTCSSTPSVTLQCDTYHDSVAGTQKRGYTYDSTSGILTDSTSTNGALLTNNDGEYGPFFEGTTANLNLLACDFDDSLLCSYKIWEALTSFYFYSTGPQRTRPTLFDANNAPVLFDAPKMVTYTHGSSESNSGKNFNNAQFLLSYRGDGDLEGLPQFCIDAATGAPGNCYYGASTPIAEFTIPTDGILTDISTGGLKYYTKPAELAEYYPYYMSGASLSTAECTSAGLTFDTFVSIEADWSTMYEKPVWSSENYPTSAELTANYFLGGKPSVIKDTPIFNIDGMGGECPSA